MFPDRRQRSFLDPGVLSRLAGFPLFARRPMLGTVSGRHPSPHRGSSVEFAEYRKYVPGDDLRRLDWRAYGRSDRFFVKEFEADTNLRCCLVLDTSGSMEFGSHGVSKIEYARRIAGAIAHIALQQGDAVGLSCVARGIVRNIPPRRNPAHLTAVFDILEQTQAKGETQLVPVLHELAETIRQRALVHHSLGPVRRAGTAARLLPAPAVPQARRGRVPSARPAELSFDFRRPMRFLDMEGGPAIFAEPNEIAERYHKALGGYLDELRQVVLESAVDYHRVSIDDELRTGAHAVSGRPGPVQGGAMSFLQPMLLAALPLVALPIIIHLINQRRYQTIRWAAMMFLLAANRMSRGYARLRQWLIMAFRMAVIAGLVFAISRPLAGGWLGLAAGNRADTTIVLLDRSPSMQQAGASGGGSKLETGRRQLVRTLETLGSAHWVLIESATNRPRELESPAALLTSPSAEPISASADLPAMLLAARDYIRANKSGRTEIWICSDLRENDWNAESGRWQSLRDSFLEFSQGVRFHLLAYPQTAPDNLAVRVTDVRRQQAAEGAELLVSLSPESRRRVRGAGNRSPFTSRSTGPGPS